MSVVDFEVRRILPGAETDHAQKEGWTNREHIQKAISCFAEHSPYGAFRCRDTNGRNIRGCLNFLCTYGFITKEERDRLVDHYDQIKKTTKKDRGA